MKVNIGPYRDRIRWPFKVNDWYFAKRFGKFNYDYDETDYNQLDKIVASLTNLLMLPINKFINYPWLDKRERNIKIRIDNYDTWNANHTLALIIHPVLLELKKAKNGSPLVDDEDVPDYLRSTVAPPKADVWDVDDNHHNRWEYVLDEMIWAFEQCTKNDQGDSEFYSGEVDWVFKKDEETKMSTLNQGPNHTFKVDREAQKAHYDRIKTGLGLFSKYYMALWT